MLRDVVVGCDPCLHEKRVAWVSISISMHACDRVPIVMGLRLAALWVAGAPLINMVQKRYTGQHSQNLIIKKYNYM